MVRRRRSTRRLRRSSQRSVLSRLEGFGIAAIIAQPWLRERNRQDGPAEGLGRSDAPGRHRR